MGPLTTRQKVGVALAGVYAVTNIPNVLLPVPEGEVGPPFVVLLLGSVLGLVAAVALVPTWRGNPPARRVVAGCNVLSVMLGLPAFFVDVPLAVKALVAFSVLWVIASGVLMFSPSRSTSPATPARSEVAP